MSELVHPSTLQIRQTFNAIPLQDIVWVDAQGFSYYYPDVFTKWQSFYPIDWAFGTRPKVEKVLPTDAITISAGNPQVWDSGFSAIYYPAGFKAKQVYGLASAVNHAIFKIKLTGSNACFGICNNLLWNTVGPKVSPTFAAGLGLSSAGVWFRTGLQSNITVGDIMSSLIFAQDDSPIFDQVYTSDNLTQIIGLIRDGIYIVEIRWHISSNPNLGTHYLKFDVLINDIPVWTTPNIAFLEEDGFDPSKGWHPFIGIYGAGIEYGPVGNISVEEVIMQ